MKKKFVQRFALIATALGLLFAVGCQSSAEKICENTAEHNGDELTDEQLEMCASTLTTMAEKHCGEDNAEDYLDCVADIDLDDDKDEIREEAAECEEICK